MIPPPLKLFYSNGTIFVAIAHNHGQLVHFQKWQSNAVNTRKLYMVSKVSWIYLPSIFNCTTPFYLCFSCIVYITQMSLLRELFLGGPRNCLSMGQNRYIINLCTIFFIENRVKNKNLCTLSFLTIKYLPCLTLLPKFKEPKLSDFYPPIALLF